MNASDRELLRSWREDGNEPAFGQLVHRHLDVVYSVPFADAEAMGTWRRT